jgi:sulfatase modifying factor 1
MVLVPKPGEGVFWMGEGKERHQQQMGHDFAISSEDVTVEQFLQFCRETGREYEFTPYAPTKECPAINVSWYEAADYCNWLSKREGLAEAQWCYEPNQAGKYAEGMKIKAGYLGLKGYRLPTGAEWEYACRAGSEAGYSFGEPAELQDSYGWYLRNSAGKTQPCGKLKPNDLGLFDMHGNVWQWMHSAVENKAFHKEDDRGELIKGFSVRVIRGGSWSSLVAGDCRAAIRSRSTPDNRSFHLGSRLARVPVEAVSK